MDVEGIYRKAGGASQVQTIKDGFESPPNPQQIAIDISDPDLDIHAISSTLKQYFRRLPNPLITYEVYDKLLDTTSIPASNREGKVDAMARALSELPRVHREVLEFLVFHLKRVVGRERENLMTSMNIAVVFAPTIMRPESLAREMSDTGVKNEVVQFLVENCREVFGAVQI
jgi:Rho-type GTPase-activating protein 1/2